MTVSDTTDTGPPTMAVVTVRIPHGDEGNLLANAEDRLSRAGSVDEVRIDDLHGLEPKLSATVITVGITVQWTSQTTGATVCDRLAETPGVVAIQSVE